MQTNKSAVVTFSMWNKNGTKSAQDIQTQFKNIPNLQTRGTTFDVRHLDQFIQFDNQRQRLMTAQGSSRILQSDGADGYPAMASSGQMNVYSNMMGQEMNQAAQTQQHNNQYAGFQSAAQNRKRAQTAANFNQQSLLSKKQFKISNIPIVYTNVRPSTSFISIPRENKAQSKYFDEQKSGPSTLLRRDDIQTLKSQGNVQLHFNTERDNFKHLEQVQNNANSKIKEFQEKIEKNADNVTFPSQRREEIQQMKQALSTFQEMKSQKIFIKKRNRLIQSGWRDGILGVEMPGDKNSYFYSNKILKEEQQKAKRLELRNTYIKEKSGQSSQIQFFSNDKCARSDNNQVQMYHGWTSKQVSDVRFKNTQDSLFGEVKNKWNQDRAKNLIIQETKGRPFNPLSGASHFLLS